MTIRRAEIKDRKKIKALIAKYPKQLLQTNLPKLREFFLAEIDGEMVGCCALEIYSHRLAEVRGLVVDDAHQRQGIASKLIKKCLKEANRLKVYEVLTVTGAVSLFEKQGFKMFNNEKYAMLRMMK